VVPTGGASAGAGIALISDDGKTLTLPATITGFVIEYTALEGCDIVAGVWAQVGTYDTVIGDS
jgi:hypothetical protein